MRIVNKISITLLLIVVTATASYAAFDVDLKKGDESAAVTEMQNFLSSNKFLTAKPNGYFGNATFAAVKAFQKKYKISQTGTFGPITRAKARSLSKSSVATTPTLSGNVKAVLDKDFTVGAWVPYWRAASGSTEVINNLSKIDIVSPFSYEMEETGTIKKTRKPLRLYHVR
jgi:peptidoglycan hydrolase-like protein with peptidoglycan-binding domain